MKKIQIHDEAGFIGMRAAGRLAANTLKYINEHVVPGVKTITLNDLCHDFMIKNGGWPAPLNYKGFPKSVCISVNDVVCHGIPSEQILCENDIVNIDVTVILNGWHGDTSRMFFVKCRSRAIRMTAIEAEKIYFIQIAKRALEIGISAAKPGNTTGDIGHDIQSFVERHRYSVVRDFCGHGIGKVFHDVPEIMHFGTRGTGIKLVPGMFFTIEPMINMGKHEVKILEDGWTAVTADKSLSAQWEHTIGITANGNEIFTL